MVYFLDIFAAVTALIFLFGIVGDRDMRNKPYYTAGFVVCMLVIIILNK